MPVGRPAFFPRTVHHSGDTPEDPLQALSESLTRMIKEPLYLGECLGYKGTSDGRKRFGKFHRLLLEHRSASSRTSIVCTRGHAKSTVEMICNMHTKIIDPASRILVASNTLALGRQLLSEMRDHLNGEIEVMPNFYVSMRDFFPWVAPRFWGPHISAPCDQFSIIGRQGSGREPCFFTGSPTMSLAGNHPTHVTVDDPANEQNSKTYMRRQQVIEFMQQLEPLMYSSDSPIRHIGTPWAFEDVSSYLANNKDYTQFRYGCWDGWNEVTGERDGNGPGPDGSYPLCSSYLNSDEIYARQNNSDNKAFFSMQYLVTPVPAEDALFDDEMLAKATNHSLSADALPDGVDILLLDPVATTVGMAPDINGILVVRICTAATMGIPADQLDPDHNIFIPHYAAEIRGNIDSALCHIESLIEHERIPNLRSIWVEDVVFSGLIKPWLKERGKIQGVQVRTQKITNMGDLGRRLKGFPTAFRKGIFQLPPKFEGRDRLIKRLVEFPLSNSDDLPAAMVLLATHLERRGQLPFDNSEKLHADWVHDPSVGLPTLPDDPDYGLA